MPASTGAAGATDCVTGGTFLTPGGACKQGPNQANGEVQTAGNGQVYQAPLGTSFDPNGGYYYARISFNF